MNMGQMIREVERGIHNVPLIGIHKASGQPIVPDEITFTIREWLDGKAPQPHKAVYQMSV